jgi:hypothetical protein
MEKFDDKYPYSFEDGVQVTDDNIARWHNEILEELRAGANDDVAYRRSGNGMVIGIRGDEGIQVYEFKNGYMYYNYTDK